MFLQNPRQILWYNFLNFSKKKISRLFFQFLFFKKNIYLSKIVENFNLRFLKTLSKWKINRNLFTTKFFCKSGCNCEAQENFYDIHDKRKKKNTQRQTIRLIYNGSVCKFLKLAMIVLNLKKTKINLKKKQNKNSIAFIKLFCLSNIQFIKKLNFKLIGYLISRKLEKRGLLNTNRKEKLNYINKNSSFRRKFKFYIHKLEIFNRFSKSIFYNQL